MSTSELLAYFAAEKQGAALIAALGLGSGALAAYLLVTRSPFRAMAWPLLILGAGQLAIGVGLLVRTDPQVARLEEGLRSSPETALASELARMDRVNRSFRVIERIEVASILVGLLLAFGLRSRSFGWASVGMGLLLEAAVLLVFDLFAGHRALAYTRWLREVSRNLGVAGT